MRWVQRFKGDKLLVNAAGFNADGTAITSSHTGTMLIAVPEPGAASALMVGGAILLGRRRRVQLIRGGHSPTNNGQVSHRPSYAIGRNRA